MKKVYQVYSDPGHGWLKVPFKELVTLGIVHRITSCSYIRGDWVFLEEDCDASTYLTARLNAGWPDPEFRHHTAAWRASRIRNYDSYPHYRREVA